MRKHNIYFLFFFPLVVLLCTCNDPVFYAISQEVKPIEPRIRGIPTNFVVYNDRIYVASGTTLYSYNNGTPKCYWNYETPPGGNIIQIASNDKYLYALCAPDTNNYDITVIKKYDKNDSSWTQIGPIPNNYVNIHNIYSAGEIIFFYATSFPSNKENSNIFFSILYIDDSETVNELKTDPAFYNNMGELCGAAYNGTSYFLLAKDRGVYKIDDFNAPAVLIGPNLNFVGIINMEDSNNTIFLISRDGNAFTVNNSIVNLGVSMGRMSTGALAIWRENAMSSSERLLLVGRQDALVYSVSYGYSYGYLELKLDSNGVEPGASFIEPGRALFSSIRGDNERYQSTLGKQPVNCLFQTPSNIDNNMTLFASTQKNGVWSYRDRSGLWQWNAEGENEP